MQFDAELLLLAMAPVFLACIGWEAWHLRRTRPGARLYSWPDTLCNVALALMQQAADKLAWLAIIPVYAFVHDHYRVHTWQASWVSFAVLFVAQDLLYYVFHRCSHRVRWLWAAHVVHHSSERMNFSTAFRQSLMYPVAGMWLFWIPLAWIGFTPDWVILAVGLNLAFQFFVHTRLGALDSRDAGFWRWLGRYVNTPSVHRVHHAKNPQYIDRNYAGVLTIWDRMFGSFVPEEDAPTFGITRQVHTHNPITLTFHEWRDMWADVFRDRDIRYLWKPPEWRSPRAAVSAEAMPLT